LIIGTNDESYMLQMMLTLFVSINAIFIPLLLLYTAVKCDTETEGYNKTKDIRNEVHETHGRILFIRPHKKWRHAYFRRIERILSRKVINTV